MTARFLKRHFLAFGLNSLLTVVMLGAFFIVWSNKNNVDETSQAVKVMSLYQRAQFHAGLEDGFATRYLQTHQASLIAQFQSSAARVNTILHSLEALQSVANKNTLQTLLTEHQRYVEDAQALFAAVDANEIALATTIDQTQADPAFHTMLQTLDGASDAAYATAAAAQARLDASRLRVLIALPLIFIACYIALALILRRQSRFQRERDAAKVREIERLRTSSLIDGLTGLGNHRAYQEDVQSEIQRAMRYGYAVSLALIDIDHFKEINHTRGHSYGDQILKMVGELMQRFVPQGNAYRLGSDTFAALFPHIPQDQARMLLEGFRQAVLTESLGVTTSVGLACVHEADPNAASLREQADAALDLAKHEGRDRLIEFDIQQYPISIHSANSIQALRHVLDTQQMGCAFQPIWDINRRHLLALEALSRPEQASGFSGPQEMFDIAERTHHEAELDRLCISRALQQVAPLPPGVLLFINVCPQSLEHEIFQHDHLIQMVQAAGLLPEHITIEITERSIHRLEIIVQVAVRLKQQGFHIALDDVGAGNSGLELLTRLDVDFVKIDQGIVKRAMHDHTARGVLTGILSIAHEIESRVIIEGIEDRAIFEAISHLVLAQGANSQWAGQGYYLGCPGPSIPGEYPLAEAA
jgi:diguanylate cyclase (GGDEF)-like protein